MTNTYNSYTLEQIEKNLPANITNAHKKEYLNNCKEFIRLQILGEGNCYSANILRNNNFDIITFYNS
jgi:hypothetical protein